MLVFRPPAQRNPIVSRRKKCLDPSRIVNLAPFLAQLYPSPFPRTTDSDMANRADVPLQPSSIQRRTRRGSPGWTDRRVQRQEGGRIDLERPSSFGFDRGGDETWAIRPALPVASLCVLPPGSPISALAGEGRNEPRNQPARHRSIRRSNPPPDPVPLPSSSLVDPRTDENGGEGRGAAGPAGEKSKKDPLPSDPDGISVAGAAVDVFP
ncbi:uncharacterized protein PSFLO_02047 [Pseudozyma flocculosa]|uniref:Uncharacterized protein n=1 Tax=Pseudozyma flocculosa TaxID=84751 RepID=A0A5C3EY59_9BASI|nr:uncharacterized protein PSFLO_02047 [Pseudozyma flocculosa]